MELKIKVPSSLSEITLGQYQRYLAVVGPTGESEVSETFLSLKMLEIFCNVPYATAMKFPVSEVNRIIKIISGVLNEKGDLSATLKWAILNSPLYQS